VDIDAPDGTGAGTKLPAPLPEGLTVTSLKNRLSGKKTKWVAAYVLDTQC